MEREIIGYKNTGNGFTAKSRKHPHLMEAKMFDVYTNDSQKFLSTDNMTFFAGSDWTPVYKEEFEIGEWCYGASYGHEWIFRHKSINGEKHHYSEMYHVQGDSFIQVSCNSDCAASLTKGKATKDQVMRILLIVARHKGFVPKALVKNEWTEQRLFDSSSMYNIDYDALYMDDFKIYERGTWATIVEEPKEEDWKTQKVLSYNDIMNTTVGQIQELAKKRASENS